MSDAQKTGPQERGHGATTGSQPHHTPSGIRVKPLDLCYALQHAMQAGRDGVEWVEYDPTECAAYRRITECLDAPHKPDATGWRDISTAPKDGTWILLYREQPELGECDPIVLGRWDEEEQSWIWPDGVCNPLDPKGRAEKRIQAGDYWFDQDFTKWCLPPDGQPLPPPPGEEVSREDLRKLVSFLAVRVERLHEERDALQARYDELEAERGSYREVAFDAIHDLYRIMLLFRSNPQDVYGFAKDCRKALMKRFGKIDDARSAVDGGSW